MIVPVTHTDASSDAMIALHWILRGLAPSQYASLNSVTSVPDMDSAVHTTPPTNNVASMPASPFCNPAASRAAAVMMIVVTVMPEMGVVEIIAMAHAETVVNRNATAKATSTLIVVNCVGCGMVLSTKNRKYSHNAITVPSPRSRIVG